MNHEFLTILDEWRLRRLYRQNPVRWHYKPWIEKMPSHKDSFRELWALNFGYLDRGLVRNFVQQKINESDFQAALIAVLVWGYTGDKRGPARLHGILENPETVKSLKETYAYLMNERIREAYERLIENGPSGIGPAFGSKFLFFSAPENVKLKPLIFDRLVSIGLERWFNYKLNSVSLSSYEYLDYLEKMNSFSELVGISSENLELVIFEESAKYQGSTTWFHQKSKDPLPPSKQRIQAWAFMFAYQLLARNSELKLEYWQPGGGQYEVLHISDNNQKFTADLNIIGSIQISQKYQIKISWDEVYAMGTSFIAQELSHVLDMPEYFDIENLTNQAIAVRYLSTQLFYSQNAVEVKAVLSDNSAYGLIADEDMLKSFKNYGSLFEGRPSVDDLLKYRYLWVILKEGIPSELIDLESAKVILPDGTWVSLSLT